MVSRVEELKILISQTTVKTDLKKLKQELKDVETQSRALRHNLLFLGLGVMFAGMALQRFATKTITSLMTAYMKVAEGNSAIGQQLFQLQAGWEFLKISIMDALLNNPAFQAFIEWIINAVNWLSEFVQKNPEVAKFVGYFLIIAGLVGGLAAFVGQVMTLGSSLMGLGPVVAPIATALQGMSLLTFAGLIAAIVALKIAWDENLGGIKDLFGSLLDGLLVTAKSIVPNIKDIFGGLWEMIHGIVTGDGGEFITGFEKMLVGLVGVVLKIGVYLAAAFKNLFIFIGNLIKDIVFNFLKFIVTTVADRINFLLDIAARALRAIGNFGAANQLVGMKIDTEGISKEIDKVKDFYSIPYVTKKDIQADLDKVTQLTDMMKELMGLTAPAQGVNFSPANPDLFGNKAKENQYSTPVNNYYITINNSGIGNITAEQETQLMSVFDNALQSRMNQSAGSPFG